MVLSFAFCFDVEGIKDCFLISRNFYVRKDIIFEIFVFQNVRDTKLPCPIHIHTVESKP